MGLLVSVIMSIYNEKLEWIEEAIKSITSQTYDEIQFIIVVDNPNLSTDVKDYLGRVLETDKRVQVIYNKHNYGLAQSLNIAARHATGTYIARMDADDISELDRFEKQISFIQKNDVDLVGTGKIIIDESGVKISEYEHVIEGNDLISKLLPYTSCFIHPTVMIKKEVFVKNNGYRNFKQSQDYDLWLRLLDSNCRFANIDEPLLKYRVRTNSITKKQPYLQYLTANYQRLLYKARIKNKKDAFSEEDFSQYLKSKDAFSEMKNIKYDKSLKMLNKGIGELKHKSVIGVGYILRAIMIFPEMFIVFKRKATMVIIVKLFELQSRIRQSF